MQVKALVKYPNKPLEIIQIDSENGWSDMTKIVGDTLDRLHLTPIPYDLTLYCDDNGYAKDLPLNFIERFTGYPILGTVCFARGSVYGDDITYEDITEDDMQYIQHIIV